MPRNLDTPSSSSSRNVHIYDNDGHVLGGVFQNGAITNTHFYEMCGIFLITSEEFTLYRLNGDGSTGAKVFRNRIALLAGSYVVLSNNGNPTSVQITNECAPRRVITKDASSKLTSRTKWFRDRVIARDNQCTITGTPHFPEDGLLLFNVAHIYPYAREQTWVDQGLSRWITDEAPSQHQGQTKIHSVQNGLLLKSDVHGLFDGYGVSVNVDDGYKIVCFVPDRINIDGRTLSLCCRDSHNPDRVPDELLRWHYRQSVLARMKGAGEKPWDMNFPDGTDIMGEIMQEPDAAERMEVEMFTRLGAGEIYDSPSPEVSSP